MSCQDSLKRFPEFRVENGVDDGVEGGVGIAEPGEYFEGDVGDASFAEGGDDVDAEEGDLGGYHFTINVRQLMNVIQTKFSNYFFHYSKIIKTRYKE